MKGLLAMIVALDATPLSLLAHRRGVLEADACRTWAFALILTGAKMVIPAIADYEVRRELLRAGRTSSVSRLDALRSMAGFHYLPITDQALHRAATLWADIRRKGLPTASAAELDCDVVLAAILQTSGLPQDQIVIATSNPKHLSRLMKARSWQTVVP